MKDSEKHQPLEKRYFEIEINGATKKVPAIDRTWVELKNRKFSKYLSHPIPVNGSFAIGEKETWLELTGFVIDNLEWLLRQRHHVFWSHMIFSNDAHQMLVSFLQEAPPHYLRNEFPKDEAMEAALEKVERLVFLVFVRLSTARESDRHFIQDLGDLLYNNYIFTVPILLDICLVYGVRNRQLVAKMIDDVIGCAPKYLFDFGEMVPHFMRVFTIVKEEFDDQELQVTATKSSDVKIRDMILHFYDTTANVQIFLDIYANGSKFFRTDSFTGEVSAFYSTVIPKMYKYIKKSDSDFIRNLCDKINYMRLDMLSIVRNVFCGIVNDVLSDDQRKGEHANEYLIKMTGLLQEPVFLSDYNSIYPIDADLKLLKDMCPDLDSENLNYIASGVALLCEASATPRREVAGVELASQISEVKDILPHLGDGFIEACLRHYNFHVERVLAAILENNLPPDIDKLDRGTVKLPEPSVNRSAPAEKVTKKARNEDMLAVLNDKRDLNAMRDRFSNLTLIPTDDYEDEYDDTYDDRDVRYVDDDQERRPFVTPRILATKEESEEEEEEEEPMVEGPSTMNADYFVPNPAEIRAKQEQKRMERAKRDYVGRGKGQGQEKQVVMNRNFKDTHKSFMANHSRRKLASRKRNMPMLNS